MPGNPPLFSETDSGDIQDLAQIGRQRSPGGGWGLRSARFEGFPACTQSQNPKFFSAAALLGPFRVYLQGKARRRRKIFTIWGAEKQIYKGGKPAAGAKKSRFWTFQTAIFKGELAQNCPNFVKNRGFS